MMPVSPASTHMTRQPLMGGGNPLQELLDEERRKQQHDDNSAHQSPTPAPQSLMSDTDFEKLKADVANDPSGNMLDG